MNKERILALADLIEQQPHNTDSDATEGFDMSITHRECGTPACIAGWAMWEAQGRPEVLVDPADLWGVENAAVAYLDLAKGSDVDRSSAYPLFYPAEEISSYESITPAQAAKVLRHLADSGNIDWSIIEEAA